MYCHNSNIVRRYRYRLYPSKLTPIIAIATIQTKEGAVAVCDSHSVDSYHCHDSNDDVLVSVEEDEER